MLEYSVWATSPLWVGENDDPEFPDLPVRSEVAAAMQEASAPPPFLGTVPKRYDSALTRLFLDYGNPLLSPDDSRATAQWLREWSRTSGAALHLREHAAGCAAWLHRAAEAGWYVDWSAS